MVCDFAGRGGELVSSDFPDSDDIAGGRRDEDFVGEVEFIWKDGELKYSDPGICGIFKEYAAGDAFEAAGVQRLRVNLAVLDGKNVGGGGFSDFAAFVELHDFVETLFLCFGYGQHVRKPGEAFISGKG